MITINYEPSGYPSAHSPMFIEAQSTNVLATDFKYLFDVYVNAALATRQKVSPSPDDNKGYLDLSQIVRSYFESEIDTPTPNSVTPVELGLGEFYVDFRVLYGEDITGTTTANMASGTTYKAYNWAKSRVQAQKGKLEDYKTKFLTTRPTPTKVFRDQPLILTFWRDDLTGNSIRVDYYTNTAIDETQTPVTTTFQYPKAFDVGNLAVEDYGSIVTSSYNYFDVSGGTQSLRFNFECVGRYQPVTLMFLNRLGGWDSMTFALANDLTLSAEKKSFKQNPFVGRSDLTGIRVRESTKVFSVQYKTKWKIRSHSLTQDEYKWLEELITSPLVYVYINDSERQWIPVQVTDTDFEIKNHLIAKDNILELTIEFSESDNSQYR